MPIQQSKYCALHKLSQIFFSLSRVFKSVHKQNITTLHYVSDLNKEVYKTNDKIEIA